MEYTEILFAEHILPWAPGRIMCGKEMPAGCDIVEASFIITGIIPTTDEQQAIDNYIVNLQRTWAERELIKIIAYYSAELQRYLLVIGLLSHP